MNLMYPYSGAELGDCKLTARQVEDMRAYGLEKGYLKKIDKP